MRWNVTVNKTFPYVCVAGFSFYYSSIFKPALKQKSEIITMLYLIQLRKYEYTINISWVPFLKVSCVVQNCYQFCLLGNVCLDSKILKFIWGKVILIVLSYVSARHCSVHAVFMCDSHVFCASHAWLALYADLNRTRYLPTEFQYCINN